MPHRYSGTCTFCGRAYNNSTSAIYCSDICYNAARKAKTERTCQQCGKTFYKKSQGHHGDPVYCSAKCSSDSKKTKVACTCAMCGKEFLRKVGEPNHIHCSRRCSDLAKCDSVEITCIVCGKKFSVVRSREKTARFCSRLCKVRYKGETTPEIQVRKALDYLGIEYAQEFCVHPYSIDFYLVRYAIALEVDGVFWHKDRVAHDRVRDAFLKEKGITTVRITDKELVRSDAATLIVRKVVNRFGPQEVALPVQLELPLFATSV